MELTGKLKEKVENAKSPEEAKEAIKDAGMILNDSELDAVAGGLAISDSAMRHIMLEQSHKPMINR